MSSSDQELQFTRLVQEHRGIVYKVAATYCFDPEDRTDLQQEIIAQLWKSFPRYDVSRPFATWMYRIALNISISYVRSTVRRRRRNVPLQEDVHDREEETFEHTDEELRVLRLNQFIAAQNDLDRALLLLYLEDHPYRTIAEILGISESNVGTKINRLKQRIRATR
jgi:RNA polymerase sigma factor (sigma-70 family)